MTMFSGWRGGLAIVIVALLAVIIWVFIKDASQTKPPVTVPQIVDEKRAAPREIPPLYIDQLIQSSEAMNRRELYDDLLQVCQQEKVSLKKLSEAERQQLGVIRLQRWIDQHRIAYRLEAWDYHMAEPADQPHCHFELVSRGRHVLMDKSGVSGIRLDDNQPFKKAPLSNMERTLLLRTPARDNVSAGEILHAVAGQPCVNRELAEATICIWAGGVEWGFEPSAQAIPSIRDADSYTLFRALILQQTAAIQQVDNIETRSFSVGEPFDESALSPFPATALPAGIP